MEGRAEAAKARLLPGARQNTAGVDAKCLPSTGTHFLWFGVGSDWASMGGVGYDKTELPRPLPGQGRQATLWGKITALSREARVLTPCDIFSRSECNRHEEYGDGKTTTFLGSSAINVSFHFTAKRREGSDLGGVENPEKVSAKWGVVHAAWAQ